MTMLSQLPKPGRSPMLSVGGLGVVTNVGLVIDGTVQCYRWEQGAQSQFARAAAKGAKHIVNIGYGLGFAHRIFERMHGVETALIEQNPGVMHRARLRSRSPTTRFVLGRWEDRLNDYASADSTIFFDGFPVERNFDYSPHSFARYLGPFLKKVSQIEWKRCYFIAFDDAPLSLPSVRGFRTRRLEKKALPASSRRIGVSNISLYELKRVIPTKGVGDKHERSC